jgi:hypothetical protein
MRQDATAGLEDYRDEALELLSLVLREHPEWRGSVLARLGSGAEEVHEASENGAIARALPPAEGSDG